MTSSLLCCSAGGDALCERGGPPRLPAVRPQPAHRLGAGLPRALVQGQVSPSDTESRDIISAVKRSIGSTIGFHNYGEGPYQGLLLVERAY